MIYCTLGFTKKLFSILIITCLVQISVSAQVFELNEQNKNQNYFELNNYINLFDVHNNSFSLAEFIDQKGNLKAQHIAAENASISFTNHYYWLTFTVKNTLSDSLTFYMETARPITDYVDLYTIFDSGDTTLQLNGDARPFDTKDYNHHKCLFRITLPANSTVQYFLSLKSDGEVINLDTKWMSADKLISDTYNEQLAFGFFYGVLFLAAIMFMFFYIAIKENTFIFYTLYVIFIGLLQFSLDGYFFKYITPNNNVIALKAVLLFACLSTLFFTIYTQSYLKIKENFIKLNYAYKSIVILAGLLFLLVAVMPQVPSFGYFLINILALLSLGLVLASLIIMGIWRVKIDLFFIIGIICLALGFTVFILCNFGIIPNSFATVNSSKIGTGLEVIFLSLSMANLIKRLRNEKDIAKSIALKKSEDMNEMKTYFMSNVSHELRTPLNAIMGIADVMLKEYKDGNVRSNIEIIKHSSLGLLSSVNDILDFGNIEKGELHLDIAPFKTTELFEQLIHFIAKQARDKGLQFKYNIDPNFPDHLNGDCMRLSQIINNVVGNAIKFTPSGTVEVKISGSPVVNDTIQFTLCVTDTGVGIPKEKMDSIYESFMQESINNKRKFGGLGLGLTIVKNLVDLQAGSINIKSEAGKGTTCTIVLPLQVVHLPPPPESIPLPSAKKIEDLNILVVEDNVMNQMILKMILKKWGNPKHTVANHGEECLQHLEKDTFDIILMDLQMPVMDGYEATIAIRAGKAGMDNQQIPIIAVTADAMDGTEKRTKEIGMDDYITKPVDADKLQKSILKLIGEHNLVLN